MRLFAALELPAALRGELAAWGAACAARDPGLRAVAPESLHVTLAFLGERADEEVEPLRWALAGLAPLGEVPLVLGGPLWLPPRRSSVLACAVEDPTGALEALHHRVRTALAEASGWQPDRRPLLAHVTVCRVRRGARPRRTGAAAEPPAVGTAFDPPELALVRSELGDGPARYTALDRVAVAPAGG